MPFDPARAKTRRAQALAGQKCTQELRVVRRGLEESCARLAGKGWLSSPEPQNESARLLGALAGQSRSKATAAPPSSDDGRYVSTASDAIYRACQVRPHTVRNLSSTGAMLDVASRVERRPISSAPFVRSESGPRLDATLREVRAKILPFRAQKSDRLLPTPASSGFAITC